MESITKIENMETQTVYDEFMELINSDISTWQESEMTENIKIWRRDYDPSTTLCLRMECLFPNVTPDVAYKVLADIRIRKKWDHRLESYEIIEENNDWCMQYNKLMKVNIPFFALRDQLIKQHKKMNYPVPGTHFTVSWICEHENYPDGKDGCVRTDALMIGY